MAGIFIDENPQVTFITTLELLYEIHYHLLKIHSMDYCYLGNLISQDLFYDALVPNVGCFENWILGLGTTVSCHWGQIYAPLDHLCLSEYRVLVYCYVCCSGRAFATNRHIRKESSRSKLSAGYIKIKDTA